MGFLVIPIVFTAALALLFLGRWTRRFTAQMTRPSLAQQVFYQPIALILAYLVWVITCTVSGDPGGNVLGLGDMHAPASELWYLGVAEGDTWWTLGFTFLGIMTVVTVVVMWWQLGRNSGLKLLNFLHVMGWVLIFSALNALTEEIIFRASFVAALSPTVEPWAIALCSAVIFGGIHYFGNPGRIPGVLLAAFMGWLLTYSIIQTGGIMWAWLIHFAQDVIILALLLALGYRAEHPDGPTKRVPGRKF